MIKYIVHTTSSHNDYYGNSYHFAQITSTKTGKSLVVNSVASPGNAAHLLLRRNGDSKPLVSDWSEMYAVHRWEKKQEWIRLAHHTKGFDGDQHYEADVTATMIRRLNRKEQDATQD